MSLIFQTLLDNNFSTKPFSKNQKITSRGFGSKIDNIILILVGVYPNAMQSGIDI